MERALAAALGKWRGLGKRSWVLALDVEHRLGLLGNWGRAGVYFWAEGTTILSQDMLAGVGSPLLLTNVGYLLKYRQTLQDLTSVEICTKEEARMCPAHVKSKEYQLW